MYEVANGVRIPTLGEQKFIGTSGEGISRQLVAQVCDVNKSLLSVGKMVNAGSRVVFDKRGSYIEDPETGDIMHMEEKHGMYVLKQWTKSSRTSF